MIRRIKRSEFDQTFKLVADAFPRETEITGLDVRRLRRMARFYSLISGFFLIFDSLHIDFETILVAVSKNKIVGEIHLVPLGKRIWSINSVAVDSQFRRRGIYRSLMKEALKYVAQRHGKKIVQSIRIDNIAPIKMAGELKFEISKEKNLLHLEISEVPSVDIRRHILIRAVKPVDIKQISEISKALSSKKIETNDVAFDDFHESFLSRIRNKIARVHSEKWVLDLEGTIVGYAGVTYTSPHEAGNIEPFHVLASKDRSELACKLLRHILVFLLAKNIRKVNVSLNKELSDVIEVFQRFGFKHFVFQYEMEKNWLLADQMRFSFTGD